MIQLKKNQPTVLITLFSIICCLVLAKNYTEHAIFACKLANKAMKLNIACDKSFVKYIDYKNITKMGIKFKFDEEYQMVFEIDNKNYFLYETIITTLEHYQNNITDINIFDVIGRNFGIRSIIDKRMQEKKGFKITPEDNEIYKKLNPFKVELLNLAKILVQSTITEEYKLLEKFAGDMQPTLNDDEKKLANKKDFKNKLNSLMKIQEKIVFSNTFSFFLRIIPENLIIKNKKKQYILKFRDAMIKAIPESDLKSFPSNLAPKNASTARSALTNLFGKLESIELFKKFNCECGCDMSYLERKGINYIYFLEKYKDKTCFGNDKMVDLHENKFPCTLTAFDDSPFECKYKEKNSKQSLTCFPTCKHSTKRNLTCIDKKWDGIPFKCFSGSQTYYLSFASAFLAVIILLF